MLEGIFIVFILPPALCNNSYHFPLIDILKWLYLCILKSTNDANACKKEVLYGNNNCLNLTSFLMILNACHKSSKRMWVRFGVDLCE